MAVTEERVELAAGFADLLQRVEALEATTAKQVVKTNKMTIKQTPNRRDMTMALVLGTGYQTAASPISVQMGQLGGRSPIALSVTGLLPVACPEAAPLAAEILFRHCVHFCPSS